MNTTSTRRALLAVLIGATLAAGSAVAQPYPSRPIKLVVPFTPGGSQDVIGRLLTQRVSESIGQQIIVENQAGAGGQIATQSVARAAPDGYTLLLSTGAQMAIEPSLRPNVGYDPLRDFVHVVHLGDAPLVLLAIPSFTPNTVKEVVDYSKANKGKVNTASTGNGTYTHLTLELFKAATGADLTHIPYKGASPAFSDLLGGAVQTMFTTTASAQPHLASNKVRAIAVTSAKRTAMLPNVPTFAESGVPGLEVSVWIGLSAPARTPPAVVERLGKEFAAALARPDLRERFAALGVEPAGAQSEVFTQIVRNDIERWARVIKNAHIKVE
jgi:tripartite-type tricarboxylate transporter receptor subunit TctC